MGSLSLIITDSTKTKTWDLLEVPFEEKIKYDETMVTTRSGKICLYHKYSRRIWKHKWAYMSRQDYEDLRGFINRQRRTGEFARISVAGLGVNERPTMLQLNDRRIIHDSGLVGGVELTMTEAEPDDSD